MVLVRTEDGHWFDARDIKQKIKMYTNMLENPQTHSYATKFNESNLRKEIEFYKSVLSLIQVQESSDAQPSGTEAVWMNDEDTYIHYHIDEDGEVIIDKTVF